ncbi:hypothetical protein WICPIJ_002621 [Wickerhamomyces pijperi]|uniref:Uncharacterized protein n=1 Tax=Wickerhamomyces pijperi TaxID=599730 RepID=A0A9P8Q9I8_WICPI|nr:hypothetical protein WICPIJ_002621 [Wickerhamomyces pijperi]
MWWQEDWLRKQEGCNLSLVNGWQMKLYPDDFVGNQLGTSSGDDLLDRLVDRLTDDTVNSFQEVSRDEGFH